MDILLLLHGLERRIFVGFYYFVRKDKEPKNRLYVDSSCYFLCFVEEKMASNACGGNSLATVMAISGLCKSRRRGAERNILCEDVLHVQGSWRFCWQRCNQPHLLVGTTSVLDLV